MQVLRLRCARMSRTPVAQDDNSTRTASRGSKRLASRGGRSRGLSGFLGTEAAHAADERGGAADGEADEIAFVFARVNDHAGFNGCESRAFVLGNAEFRFDDGVGVERGVDGGEQSGNAFAGERGNGYRRLASMPPEANPNPCSRVSLPARGGVRDFLLAGWRRFATSRVGELARCPFRT